MHITTLLQASGKTLMTTAAVTVVSFFTSVITARALGPEGRGLLSAALLVCTLSGNIAQLGFANTFIYHKGAGRQFNYRRFFVASLLTICLSSVVLAYVGIQISKEHQLHSQLLLILCMAGFTGSQAYFTILSQLQHDLHFFNVMRFGLVFGNLILLLILLLAFNPIGYQHILFTQFLVAVGLTALGLLWAARNRVWKADEFTNAKATWRDMLSYALAHYGTVILSIALVNFDKLTLLKMGTMVQFGFYTLAFTTSRLIGAAQEAVNTALYARFAGGNVDELSLNVKAAFRLSFFPMLVMAAIGAQLAPWLIAAVYGKAFASMAVPFSILLFECVIAGASWTLAQRFNAGGRPGLVLVRQCISVAPVFMALPFLPQQDIQIYLSGLLLCGAILRLVATLALYPISLKEPVPAIFPTFADFKAAMLFLNVRRFN